MREIENINIKLPGITGSLLLVAFIVLKLCHVIDWAWIWVLLPLWFPFAIIILGGIVIGLCFLIAYLLSK